MAYVNPIPHPDDEYQSTVWSLTFYFNEPAVLSEAFEGICNLIYGDGNKGTIAENWLKMGTPRTLRHVLEQPTIEEV